MAAALGRMAGQIIGVTSGIDARQDGGSGLSGAGGRYIPIFLFSEIHKRVQFIAVEFTVPVLRGPVTGRGAPLTARKFDGEILRWRRKVVRRAAGQRQAHGETESK